MSASENCYDFPQYWDLAFSDETEAEADFVQAVVSKYCSLDLKSVFEPACGGGRLLLELARRAINVTGCDLSEAAVRYAQQRLQSVNASNNIVVADMRTHRLSDPVDVACCFVNSFRHLLTEEDAVEHLQTMATNIRPGGLYLIGMHLLPPDADEEDDEEWSVTEDGITVEMRLDVTSCDRETRLETLRFEMLVQDPAAEQSQRFVTEYPMRIYLAEQFRSLIEKVPEFHLLDVYDFWFDIDEPLILNDDLGDTVFVLQRST
ncbi:MAG: class I SAM-dependent methyltransferase [Planctomycetaceae bacterium]|nr:class I SAM-dependent methyltransferase [Planctomycetaceae bacterium]